MNSKITRDITYGMYIITSKDEKNAGCVINTVCQITNGEFPKITVSLNKNNYTNGVIRKSKKFAISVISENINPNIISTFGFSSSKEIDKFQGLKIENIDDIPVLIDGVTGYMICEVESIIDCETHDIFIANISSENKINSLKPMTYTYYHEVIKGKAPKYALTYIEEKIEHSEVEKYKCTVCGYVYEGKIPDNFICPVCGKPHEYFEKI